MSCPLLDQQSCISTEAGRHFTDDLAGELGASAAQLHQLVAGASVSSVALSANLLGDLLAGLAGVARGASATEVHKLTQIRLHQHSGLEVGAAAALASGDAVVGADCGVAHVSRFGVRILYTIGSPWQPCLIESDARGSPSPGVQWIELAPHQVTQRIIHVIMPGILVWVTFIGVALQL
jgi:hypothetical protein